MKEEITFSVKKPREEVFKALSDFDAIAQLAQGKVSIKKTDEGHLISADLPGLQGVLCRTLEYTPPQKCVRRFEIKDLPTTLAFTFDEEGTGTKVTLNLEMTAESMVYKMMLPMLEKKLREEKTKTLAQLQSRLDAA